MLSPIPSFPQFGLVVLGPGNDLLAYSAGQFAAHYQQCFNIDRGIAISVVHMKMRRHMVIVVNMYADSVGCKTADCRHFQSPLHTRCVGNLARKPHIEIVRAKVNFVSPSDTAAFG